MHSLFIYYRNILVEPKTKNIILGKNEDVTLDNLFDEDMYLDKYLG